MPIIPASRDLPNQIDLLGPVTSRIRALGGITEGIDQLTQALERIEQEEARTEAAEIISEAVISQKTALSRDKEFDAPELYQKFVGEEFKKTREFAEARATKPLIRSLVRRGLAQSEASLADEFGTRISNLRLYKAQGHIISYLDNVKKDASMLSPEDRMRRIEAAEAYLDSTASFNAREKETMKIKFREQMDEAAVLARRYGVPGNPEFKNPTEALALLEPENTPFLSDKRREELFNGVQRDIDRAKDKGTQVSKDIRNNEMSKIYVKIFEGKESDAQIDREVTQLVKDRMLDVNVDPDQVKAWLAQRRDGVSGSHESYIKMMDDFYSPLNPETGMPDPITQEKIARYRRRAVATPMNPDDRVKMQSRLWSIGEALFMRQDTVESRNLSDYLRRRSLARLRLRDSYSNWLDRDAMLGRQNAAVAKFTELAESMDPEAAVDEALRLFPPKEGKLPDGGDVDTGALRKGLQKK